MSKDDTSTASLNAFYDQRYAGNYMDTDAYSVWGHEGLRAREIVETLNHVPMYPREILDYGCGVGGWIGLLKDKYPQSLISGVDVSSTAIEKARLRFVDCRFENFDGRRAPFHDNHFDLIFSYHVLEHVADFEASISDIARMLRTGGHAVIIFPCGNKGSFLDRTMSLFEDAWQPTQRGERALFFEIDDGHIRRVTSQVTIDMFGKYGHELVEEYFSGHLFGTIDWLCRGTGPAYINRVFSGNPSGVLSRIRLDILRRALIGVHRLIQRKSLDTAKKRHPLKQAAVIAVKTTAIAADRLIATASAMEWRHFKSRRNGTAQYLVFRKK